LVSELDNPNASLFDLYLGLLLPAVSHFNFIGFKGLHAPFFILQQPKNNLELI
jgi:hypothetical protein